MGGGEINSKNCHYETKNISKTLVNYLNAIIKIVKKLSSKIIDLKSKFFYINMVKMAFYVILTLEISCRVIVFK